MGKETVRKLTRDEKFAIQQMGRFWKDWLYLREAHKESACRILGSY